MCFILELHPSFCTCFEGICLPWIWIPTFHEQSWPMNHQRCLGSVRSKWQLQGQSTVVDKNSPGFHLSFQARLFFSRISLLNVKSFMFPFSWYNHVTSHRWNPHEIVPNEYLSPPCISICQVLSILATLSLCIKVPGGLRTMGTVGLFLSSPPWTMQLSQHWNGWKIIISPWIQG